MNVFPTSQKQGYSNCARLKNDNVARSFLLDKKTPDSPVRTKILTNIKTNASIIFEIEF